jgi:hypothetical protein
MSRQVTGQPSTLTPWQEFQLALKKSDADVPALVFQRDHKRPTLRVTRIKCIGFEGDSNHGQISADGVFDRYEKYVDYKIDLYIQSTKKYENKWSKFDESSSITVFIPADLFVLLYKTIIEHESRYDFTFSLFISGAGEEDNYGVLEYPCKFEALQFRRKPR